MSNLKPLKRHNLFSYLKILYTKFNLISLALSVLCSVSTKENSNLMYLMTSKTFSRYYGQTLCEVVNLEGEKGKINLQKSYNLDLSFKSSYYKCGCCDFSLNSCSYELREKNKSFEHFHLFASNNHKLILQEK